MLVLLQTINLLLQPATASSVGGSDQLVVGSRQGGSAEWHSCDELQPSRLQVGCSAAQRMSGQAWSSSGDVSRSRTVSVGAAEVEGSVGSPERDVGCIDAVLLREQTRCAGEGLAHDTTEPPDCPFHGPEVVRRDQSARLLTPAPSRAA